MNTRTTEQGFTAVELLITLFVAAAFLIAGYQLFNVVIKDGSEARAQALAANTAYDYMRQYSTSAQNPCAASVPLNNSAVIINGLTDTYVTVAITCPQSSAPTISKIDVTVAYANFGSKTVRYATFVDTSGGVVAASDLSSGLIGSWQFNGNANGSSPSGLNGTVTNATLTTGQNGTANGAYSFNGTNAYITVPTTIADPTTALSASAWIRLANVQQTSGQRVLSTIQNGGYALAFNTAECSAGQFSFVVQTGGIYRNTCLTLDTSLNNAWFLVTGVYDGSTAQLYVNGAIIASVPATGGFNAGTSTTPLCIGSSPTTSACTSGQYFSGSIDDVRIYNRALTPNEVQLLYTGGAQ